MTQREKIVGHVSQMVSSLGIKSVRMDDVANSLGMSKRTLYEMFGDKEELLYESIMYRIDMFHRDIARKTAGCDNMLEILLISVRELNGSLGLWTETERRMMINLKRFYPNVFEKVQRNHGEQSVAGLKYALDKCRDDGYLDPNLDIELITQLFVIVMGTLMGGNDIVLPEGVTRMEACSVMMINFLRGLCSVKGLQVMDEILKREGSCRIAGKENLAKTDK